MEDSYRLVLEKVLEYEQRQQRIICAFLVIAIIIVALVAAKQFRKTNCSNKVVVCAILIVLCAALPLYVLTCKLHIRNILWRIFSRQLSKRLFLPRCLLYGK